MTRIAVLATFAITVFCGLFIWAAQEVRLVGIDPVHAPRPQEPIAIPVDHTPRRSFEIIDNVVDDPMALWIENAEMRSQAAETERENARLRIRCTELEAQLAVHGEGPVGRWLELPGVVRPDDATIVSMARLLAPYQVELQAHEGAWVADRVRENDWRDYAMTIDEALVDYLGRE